MHAQSYALPNQLDSSPLDEKLPFPTAVAVFLLGAATGYPIQIVGRIYPGELVLVIVAIWAFIGLFAMDKSIRAQILLMVGAMLVGLAGYVASDIYRGTAVNDYVRGWSKWVFMITTFLALVKISYRQPKFLYIFMVGFSLVNGTLPLVMGGGGGFFHTWKFFMAVPFTICCLYGMYLLRLRPTLVALALIFIGALHAALDTRAPALMCLLSAGLVLLASKKKSEATLQKSLKVMTVLASLVVLTAFAFGAVFIVTKYAEAYGLAGRQTRSTVRRIAMVKSTLSIIRDSPILGYGSWARNPLLAKKQEKMMEKLKAINTRGEQREDIIIAHSQVLQAWVEGGILGVAFCVFLGLRLGFSVVRLGMRYQYHLLVPFYAFMLWHCSWHLLFSPFKGTQRIFIPVACVVIVQIAYDMNLYRSMASAREWLKNYWSQATVPQPSYG